MDTHLSYNKNKNILEIDCEDFKISIAGNESKSIKNNKNVRAALEVRGEYEKRITVKICDSNGELVECTDDTMIPSFYENGEYQIVLISKINEDLKVFHMDKDLTSNMQNYSNYKVFIVKFISDIGYSTFSIIRNGTSILNFTIEIFPSKIDYKSDYQEIIKEINNEISALSFDKSGKTYLNSSLQNTNNQSDTEYINIFMSIIETLENDIKSICRQPKAKIETVEVICPIEKSRHISNKTVTYIRKHQNTLIESKDGFINLTGNNKAYIPTKVMDNRKITTINIYENQYVKYIITSIIKRLGSIGKNIINVNSKEGSILSYIKEKRTVLERYIKVYFKEVNDLSVEKAMDLGLQSPLEYRRLYENYNLLKKALIIGGNSFQITPKKIYKLYEIWCYLKINYFLRELGYIVKSNTIFKYSDNGSYLSLFEGEEGKIVYQKGLIEIELWYNKTYSFLPTTKQKPDIVLGIKNVGLRDERFYIFDAKYRIKSESSGGVPMEEDINVMHRYRDSIVSRKEDGKGFKHDILGAYVLFPCSDEKLFMDNKFYRSIDEVNIGALPMLPGNIELMKVHLEKIIGFPAIIGTPRELILPQWNLFYSYPRRN